MPVAAKRVKRDSTRLNMHNYSFHPLADLFPLMEGAEFDELVADIKNNGLREPIALWGGKILDGRNRYRACIAAGFKPYFTHLPTVDPTKYVISVNLHRRHLTAEQKRELIVQLLKADPTKSNRQVAKLTDTSHPHVAKVRGQAEKAGDVETVTTSVDTKGRQQPARKLSVKKHRRSPEQIRVEIFKDAIENTTRHLETLSEMDGWVPQLSTEDADRAIEQIRCGERALRAIANRIKQVRSGAGVVVAPKPAEPAAPDGDGLDIPEWLRRTAP